MTWVSQLSIALRIAAVVGLVTILMFGVTTFLFAFSGGQGRMEPVVKYVALVVFAVAMVLTAIVWILRSPRAAVVCAGIATPVAWAVAVFIEWRI